jgi:hypothetical protein
VLDLSCREGYPGCVVRPRSAPEALDRT